MMDGTTIESRATTLLVQILKHELTHQIGARILGPSIASTPGCPSNSGASRGWPSASHSTRTTRGQLAPDSPGQDAPRAEAGIYFTSAPGATSRRNLEALPKARDVLLVRPGAATTRTPGRATRRGRERPSTSCSTAEHGPLPQGPSSASARRVHKGKIQPTTFEECYPGIDQQRMHRQWFALSCARPPLDDGLVSGTKPVAQERSALRTNASQTEPTNAFLAQDSRTGFQAKKWGGTLGGGKTRGAPGLAPGALFKAVQPAFDNSGFVGRQAAGSDQATLRHREERNLWLPRFRA